jgi:hypothetical protein
LKIPPDVSETPRFLPSPSVLLIKLRFLKINMSIEIKKSCSGRAGVGR